MSESKEPTTIDLTPTRGKAEQRKRRALDGLTLLDAGYVGMPEREFRRRVLALLRELAGDA